MQVTVPQEALPDLGTVSNPAVFLDGDNAFVCYEASLRAGGGNVVLRFSQIIDFRTTPMNVEGLTECRYPIKPYAFNEILDVEETIRWNVLKARLWLISFNDLTLEVLFHDTVSIIGYEAGRGPQHRTLINALVQSSATLH